MNIELREAQARYEAVMPSIIQSRNGLYETRERFVRYFTPTRLRNLHVDHFALGNDLLPNGLLFCYTLERGLDGLGRITGATASKFGVYYGKTKSDSTLKYRFTKKFGNTLTEAYGNVRAAIIDLLQAGEAHDLDRIVANPLSPMFKGKILATYYPEEYLNIFSYEHLNHFLIQLNLDTRQVMEQDEVYKREELLRFKNNDPVMRHWPVDLFAHFLYIGYPGGPRAVAGEGEADDLEDFRLPEFPANPEPTLISLSIVSPDEEIEKDSRRGSKNPDYEGQARRLKKYGDRGEKIVLDMERKRLIDAGKSDLAGKVKKAEFDYNGYDIFSREVDGTEKYIEVKATVASPGPVSFFLSYNELEKAQSLKNYHVYVVFDILSATPRVWPIGNPFHPENSLVIKKPVNFRVDINAGFQ